MPTLSITKNYSDGTILTESQLDDIKNSLETFINATKLDADNLQDSAITTAKIASEAVTAAKIASAVAGNGLTGGAGTALAVNVDDTGIEINADALRLKDGGVTQAKRAALGQQISSTSGGFWTTNNTLTDVTNLSVSITTTGRPVFVGLISDGTDNAYVGGLSNGGLGVQAEFNILRDTTIVSQHKISNPAAAAGENTLVPAGSVWHIDTPSSGTYTYKVQAMVDIAGSPSGYYAYVNDCKLIAYEL